MIQTIEQATHTRVLIGQNGIVVVTGRDPEGINQAVKAIRMVEEAAHTANLTQRIKALLNVPDTPTPQDAPAGEGGTRPQETAEQPATAERTEGGMEVSEK
jgi:exosome complex component RRP4